MTLLTPFFILKGLGFWPNFIQSVHMLFRVPLLASPLMGDNLLPLGSSDLSAEDVLLPLL